MPHSSVHSFWLCNQVPGFALSNYWFSSTFKQVGSGVKTRDTGGLWIAVLYEKKTGTTTTKKTKLKKHFFLDLMQKLPHNPSISWCKCKLMTALLLCCYVFLVVIFNFFLISTEYTCFLLSSWDSVYRKHPCRHWRQGWVWFWAAWSSG